MTALDELFDEPFADVVPDAVSGDAAAALRAAAEAAGFTRWRLVDRGRYAVAELAGAAAGTLTELAMLASDRVGRPLVIAEARVLRLGAGDYLLAHHDRVYEGRPIELMLDVSAASVPGAEVHYRLRGRVFLRVPSVPGTLAIIERAPVVTCNHTYVSKRHMGAAIVRLVVVLRDR